MIEGLREVELLVPGDEIRIHGKWCDIFSVNHLTFPDGKPYGPILIKLDDDRIFKTYAGMKRRARYQEEVEAAA